MSILYIRLPSKAAADDASSWSVLPCPFALVAQGDAIEREGIAPLSDLSALMAKAQRLVLLLAAVIVAVRNPDPEKVSAYECGFNAFDDARMKFDIRFYLVSILFIICLLYTSDAADE